MKLDVYLTPGEVTPGEIAGRTVVVLDVLRATTSIIEALSAGARSIYPVASIEDALRLANTFGRDEVVLCGERKCLPIEGFDLGNSPREFTPDRVGGKTLVMTTTNGTYAMMLTVGAERVLIGSLSNLDAVVDELTDDGANPAIICAGRERGFAMEDAVCAGAMAARLLEVQPGDWQINDGAMAAMALAERFGTGEDLFATIAAGRLLLNANLEKDLAVCAERNRRGIVPVLHERQIVLSPPVTSAVARDE